MPRLDEAKMRDGQFPVGRPKWWDAKTKAWQAWNAANLWWKPYGASELKPRRFYSIGRRFAAARYWGEYRLRSIPDSIRLRRI